MIHTDWSRDADYWGLSPAQEYAWMRRITAYYSGRVAANYDRSQCWYRRSRKTFVISVCAALFNVSYVAWNTWHLLR